MIASERPAIDDAQDDLSPVLEVRDADDGSKWQRAMRGHEFLLVENFPARRPIAIEAWSVK
jgi:hypothetical protein